MIGCAPAQYNLSISSTRGGRVTTPGESTFTYDAGTVVSLVATPYSGYWFVNWTGDVDTIANVNTTSTSITMDGNYSITANFVVVGEAARLQVDSNGVLSKDGEPYRGIGVNYFEAVPRALLYDDGRYREGFKTLAQYHIPFARIWMGPFWPSQWQLYLDDPDCWFKRIDNVVLAAEEYGVGLFPSLFWMISTVPDIVGEPVSAWGDPNSKTHAFMRQYVKEVVTRYKDSPAIWAWEFGNEYNLLADVRYQLPVVPWLGTPTQRTEADYVSHDMVVTALVAFGEAVREYDPVRPITTGNGMPRAYAEHLRRGEGWTQDSKEEFTQNIQDVTPHPYDLGQIHLYPLERQYRWGQTDLTYEDLIRASMDALADAKKALFLGEFGAAIGAPEGFDAATPEEEEEENKAFIAAIEATGVPLAAISIFDSSSQFIGEWAPFNINVGTRREYLLDLLQEANNRLIGAMALTTTTLSPLENLIREGEGVVLTAPDADSGDLWYQWYRDGKAIPGETSQTLELHPITAADSGTCYTIRKGL